MHARKIRFILEREVPRCITSMEKRFVSTNAEPCVKIQTMGVGHSIVDLELTMAINKLKIASGIAIQASILELEVARDAIGARDKSKSASSIIWCIVRGEDKIFFVAFLVIGGNWTLR